MFVRYSLILYARFEYNIPIKGYKMIIALGMRWHQTKKSKIISKKKG